MLVSWFSCLFSMVFMASSSGKGHLRWALKHSDALNAIWKDESGHRTAAALSSMKKSTQTQCLGATNPIGFRRKKAL